MKPLLSVILCLFCLKMSLGQGAPNTVSGFVLDENNDPIPYVAVYVKQLETGTVTDEKGRYFFDLEEGYYDLVFSSLGYEEQIIGLVINGEDIVKNVYMTSSLEELNEVVIRGSKKDPAYPIIREMIAHKKVYQKALDHYKCEVYTKSKSTTSYNKKVPKKDSKKYEKYVQDSIRMDSIRKSKYIPPRLSLLERQITLYYQFPDKFKEIKHAETLRGSKNRLYEPRPGPSDFNFYYNLIETRLTEAPLVSPIANSAFLSYNYKLLETFVENNKVMHRIQVIPRSMGNGLFRGEIVVVEDQWYIQSIHLSLPSKLLKAFDDLTIEQSYDLYSDSIVLLKHEHFNYTEKYGREEYIGSTDLSYEAYNIDTTFSKKHFNNEVRRVEMNAYVRDTSYWNLNRPEDLSLEEQQYVKYTDSLKALKEKESYLDSMDREYNKITWKNLLYFGQGYVNREKREVWYFSSLTGMIEPVQLGGARVLYWFTYHKEFKNRKSLFLAPNYSVGVLNNDHKYRFYGVYHYNPMKFARVYLWSSRYFSAINPDDNWVNMLKRTNYFENQKTMIAHFSELFNGFWMYASADYGVRSSIDKYKFWKFADDIFENNVPQSFAPFNSFNTELVFTYTPAMKYIREPYRKVNLGSKYPTLRLYYKKGWDNILNSITDFDFIEFEVFDRINLKKLGNSTYSMSTGKFFNANFLTLVDYKYQRGADPYLFLYPLENYQLLEETFPTFDWYIEGHYMHSFNGVIINKFPLIRKLGLRTLAGASYLYAFENDYLHSEIYGGFEKDFKLFKEKFRFGVFYAVGASNQGNQLILNEVKFSIKHFDRKNQRFEF